jgi:hypothetical protein
MVYFLQHDDTIISINTVRVKRLVNNIPPKPVEPRKNLTIVTLEKLISNELLLNLIPAITAQKIHTPISIIIKPTNERCFLIGSNNEYENLLCLFIQYVY